MIQPPLFTQTGEPTPFAEAKFSGAAFDAKHDKKRLTKQIWKIFDLMKDGKWRTLAEIEKATGAGQSSASAQLRNLKKPSFGSHGLQKQPRGERSAGLWEYKIIVNEETL